MRLEREILEISERERRVIGQDIHDSLSQSLTGIAFMLKRLELDLKAKSSEEARQATRLTKLLSEAITQTRRITRGLNPVDFEATGLVSSLEQLASSMEKGFDITCRIRCERPFRIQDNEKTLCLFRIVQEAVHRAVRYGKANDIVIGLEEEGGMITLTLEDNGARVPSVPEDIEDIGLRMMKYRANRINASLEMLTGEGSGNRLICTFQNQET
jgi:signal transduction histidine kinase